MGRLDLKLLGSPEVYQDDHRLRFRARKSLALLAYLAAEGGLHRREKLVALLWPRSNDARGRAALRSALAGLRGALSETGEPSEAPHLLAEGDSLGLRSGPDTHLDLHAVEAALQPAPANGAPDDEVLARLRGAAEACRGEFLEGFSLDDAPEFDHWVDGEREAWRRRAGLVHARLARLELDYGLSEEATATAARWLDRSPADEVAGALLMEARLALGDGGGALEAYEALRRALAEIGAELAPATEGLAASIRATSSAPRRAGERPSEGAVLPRGLPDLPLVGRAEEFGALVEEYHASSRMGGTGGFGGARVVAVTGEAGIGKTRLVEEFLLWARAEGAEVLRGGALETRGRLPYGPVVDALRPRLEGERAPDDLLSDLWLSELSRLLPELSERYPDLPAPAADEALAQAHLFEAVARLVGTLAERAPVVLFLDDLQWADWGTLDLLRHAARRWFEDSAPVLLIAGIRAEALDYDGTLSEWVSWLVRDRRARRLELEILDDGDVSRLLAASANGAPGGGSDALRRFGGWLFEETGGQPFFLTETLRALSDRGLVTVLPRSGGGWTLDVSAAVSQEDALRGVLPPGVHEVLRVRLSHLSPRAAQALSAAAVLGQRFSFETLIRVASLSEDEGLDLLDEAERARLVREADAEEDDPAAVGYYAFSHDKIRDVAYTEAGAARRRVLHRRALEALEGEGAPSAELARHATGAGLLGATFRHSLAAGDEAMALFAVGDADAHYERARSLLEGSGRRASTRPSPSEAEHLYVNLGRARELAGRWEEAKEAYEELRDRGREAGEPRLEWAALNRLAILAALRSQDLGAASSLIREALRVTETAGDRAAAAETEWNLAQMATLGWRTDEAIPLGGRALGVARESGDQELAARCLYTLSFAYAYAGRWEECVGHAREAVTLYRELGDRSAQHSPTLGATFMWAGLPPSPASANRAMESLCLSSLAIGETNLGTPGSGEEPGRRALEIARELGNPSAEVSAAMMLHYALSERGEYEEALGVAREAVGAARRVGAMGGMGSTGLFVSLLALGKALQTVLDFDGAREAYLEAEGSHQSKRLSVLSSLCAVRGMVEDWDGAHAHAKAASSSRREAPSRLFMWDFGRHHEVEALLRGGDEELAREEAARLGEAVGENRRFRLVHLRMLAVVARWDGEPREALERLREAGALADEMGLPGERWEIHAAVGDVLDGRGEQEEAREAFGRAAENVLALAGGIEDEKLRKDFLSGPPVRRVLERR